MRLIHTRTFELREVSSDESPPRYAILSHTWERDEVTFQDWQHLRAAKRKSGFFKIAKACQQAQRHGIKYLWVDTNCIDKTSSAELSEAINSMFAWYRNAERCYVYLVDVSPMCDDWEALPRNYTKEICESKWFTRGWTLQELLAPVDLTFYAEDWSKIASRKTLADLISSITRIDTAYLTGGKSLAEASVAQKMSWLSCRKTRRVEDMAYSMLGLFDINMPLLYGEGKRAFVRLQEEIIKVSDDHTIFCWTWDHNVPSNWVSLLAPCPQVFEDSSNYSRTVPDNSIGGVRNYTMTNIGLSITLPVVQGWSYYFGVLNAHNPEDYPRRSSIGNPGSVPHASIPIRGFLHSTGTDNFIMERIPFPPSPVFIHSPWILCQPALFIRSTPELGIPRPLNYDVMVLPGRPFKYGFLMMFDNTNDMLDLKNPDIFGSELKKLNVSREELVPVLTEAFASGIVYLTERTKDLINVETFPPEMFDPGRSLIRVEKPEGSSVASVLVRLGPAKEYCAVFLGLRFQTSPYGEELEPHRFCRVIPNIVWAPHNLRFIQEKLEAQMCQYDNIDTHYFQKSSELHCVINAKVTTTLGLIYPTYITSEWRRVRWFGTERDEFEDDNTS